MKTIPEIDDMIQQCDHCGQGGTLNVLDILEQMNVKMGEIEGRLNRVQCDASLASSTADPMQKLPNQFEQELTKLREEVECVIELCGKDAVRVHENNGPEEPAASLAVTVAKIKGQRDRMRAVLEKFVAKVESGQARSQETYAEAKRALL